MCLKIQNPVVSEELRLDCLYVDPDIKVLRETTDPGRGLMNVQDKQIPANVSRCRQLFYTKDYKCRQIYITGDAGFGKSVYCKHLVDLWCSSEYDNSEDIKMGSPMSKEDMEIMLGFKLLFYIRLRESPSQYHLADMIKSQILKQDEEFQHLNAYKLLKKVPCLVIVDGLDEWACPKNAEVTPFVNPGIPDRDWLNKTNVFLTTTRSWKFDVLQLTSSEVDKHVELAGFNSNSSEMFCFKIIKLLESAVNVERNIEQFQTELQDKKLSHLRNIPVILTQLICLWFDEKDLGQSQVQLYCSMLEMLLKRAFKNLPEQTCTSSPVAIDKGKILPPCFSHHRHCQARQHLLINLCTVAFEALFNHKREHALVFESSQMEILGVNQIDVDLCLKSGILSQSKVIGKWSKNEKKISFLHTKVQEFLAAIFITCENEESVILRVKNFCTTVETVLEMSQVLMFVSGIKPDLGKQLLTDLMTDVVLKDTRLLQHREFVTDENEYPTLALSIQTCIVDCIVEARSNGHLEVDLPLEDFVIRRTTISSCLESLITLNKSAVKSVYILALGMTDTTLERILCQVQNTSCLQKLYLYDPYSVINNMEPLCQTLDNNKNLICLHLQKIPLTTASSAAVCGTLNHVTTFYLYNVKLTHEQKEHLLSCVSQARNIKHLQLEVFNCSDHGWQCRPCIDLSSHTQLHTLSLMYLYVEHLPEVTECVKDVKMCLVTIAERQLRQFIHELSSISHTMTVNLYDVTVIGDNEEPVDMTDLKHNDTLLNSQCRYSDNRKTCRINFHTQQQQTTIESDNQTQTNQR